VDAAQDRPRRTLHDRVDSLAAGSVSRSLRQHRRRGDAPGRAGGVAVRLFAQALHDDGHLRAGVSRNEARDVLWTYNSAEIFQLLVLEQ
jgi:hypothetical protein